jgi:site-specific DNA-methyltransferase (adenine-specific)
MSLILDFETNKSVKISIGDCRELLRQMPDNFVHTCVTSPPYFGLRDYGMEDQIGLEQTPEAFVNELVAVFREVRRVLRDDGTLWLNLGDSYAGSGKGRWGNGNSYATGKQATSKGTTEGRLSKAITPDCKPKDLIGIPWRVAFALQADGWYLRQDIIWHKPNPMPESVQDRCTKAHEYIFLLSKSPRYYFDAASIEEDAKWERWGNQTENKKHVGTAGHLGGKTIAELPIRDKKNRRSVWTVATKPFKGAHFATFPPGLIEPCILAGCPEGGIVLDPFGGAGTTGLVAALHNRKAILLELNPEYGEIARKRLEMF